MADKTSTIALVFDIYRQGYDKDSGAKSSLSGAFSEKKYFSSVKTQIGDLQKNSFLGKKNAALFNASSVIALVSGLASGGLTSLTFGNLLKNLKSQNLSGNVFRDMGMAGLIDTLGTLENVASDLINKFVSALLSQIYIPDVVYLASLVALDAAGADLEMNNNYIRNLILKRDLTVCLKWWNDTWGISYSGLASDVHTSDSIIAARNGAWENLRYILDKFYDSYKKLNLSAQNEKDERIKNEYLSCANLIYSTIVYCTKLVIVYGYGNFKAGDVKDMLKAYDIHPDWFGGTDDRFSGKFNFDNSDIEIMAPYYTPAKKGLINSLDAITQNRSSKYRRAHGGGDTHNSKFDFRKSFINPRNKNIKRIYLTLTDSGLWGKNHIMYNPNLARRLELKIMTTIGNVLDESLSGLIPNAFFDITNKVWDSAYDYTVKIESFLKNPPKMQYIILEDSDVVKTPAAIPLSTGKNNGDNKTKKSNGLTDTQNKTTGTKLVIKDIKDNNLTDLPTSLEDYIKQLVDTYVALDLKDYLQKVLDDIRNGVITVGLNDSIEALILKKFKDLGGDVFELVKLNMAQVYAEIVAKIKSGEFNEAFLNANTIDQIQRLVVSQLTASGVYVQLKNNSDDINMLKLMMIEMQKKINGIIDGTIQIDTLNLQEMIDNSIAKHQAGESGDIGKVSQLDLAMLTNLNNLIYNSGLAQLSYDLIMKGQTFQDLINNAQSELDDGLKIIDSAEKALLLVNTRLDDIYKQIMDGSLDLQDIPTMEDFLNLAKEVLKNSTDISDIINALKAMGIDVNGIDPYLADLKKTNDLLKGDPGQFEFDINNPPDKVKSSLYSEYYGDNCINLRYKWIDDGHYMQVFHG